MAIIRTIIGIKGNVFPDQYCRVDEVTTDKSSMRFTIGIYLNKAATDFPPHAAEVFEAPFDLYSSLNIWQQAYEAIKQLWPDAVDEI